MMLGVVLLIVALVAVSLGFPADSDLTPDLRAVKNIVTFQQAWFGIAVAAFIMLAYAVLYPRGGVSV